jgi:alpha,alpha-trehalose phosphorylase
VIEHSDFDVEPWRLREAHIDLNVIAQSESLFTLANGHIGWRGNLDEGEPHGLQGSYLDGVFELRPLPYAEAGYGYPEEDQVVVNVTDAKVIRLLVDDEPLDIRYGDLHAHTRELDFRTGLLKRDLDWSTPTGRRVKVTSTRLVSFTQRALAAIKYEVEAVDAVRVVVQSELVANEAPPRPAGFDPRESAALDSVWTSLEHASGETWAVLVHSTNYSNLIVAAGMEHQVSGPSGTTISSIATEDVARVMITSALAPGEKLTVVKLVGYGWSGVRTKEALRDQVDAALEVARTGGWNELCREQREYLDDYWQGCDVEIDGDEEIQQAVRFALFHVLQSGARNEQRAIPAKGLTGTGYDGHAFWDTESFVLTLLNYAAPETVAHALRWRYSTLDLARDRAELLGFRGAAFPWRTIAGEECSSYWPAGTAAFHVSADVANAVVAHLHATGDEKFEHDTGAEILIETSRLWLSLGHFDLDGGFRLDGVTGPDEYSAIADNNIYTNLMVQRSLRVAADAAERHDDVASALEVSTEEIVQWRHAADAMVIPFDEELGVHSQSEGFTRHELWNFAGTKADQYPLLLHFPYFDLYRKQVVKQADLVFAMYLRPDAFSAEQKKANFDYYEPLTVRDSSLSACIQSVMAAEVGYLSLAYDYAAEAALLDIQDLEHNTRDGLHMASLAGTWIALVAGFAGLRPWESSLSFAPRLPEGITRLAFSLHFRGRHLHVRTSAKSTTYEIRDGDALELRHGDENFTVTVGNSVVMKPLAPLDPGPAPRQPAGREPVHRMPDAQREQESS